MRQTQTILGVMALNTSRRRTDDKLLEEVDSPHSGDPLPGVVATMHEDLRGTPPISS